jgi:hypothetical protein
VRRAEHLAVHHAEQLSRRAVHGHRVGRRTEAVQGVAALGVGMEDAAEIMLLLVVVLLLVKAYACQLAVLRWMGEKGQGQVVLPLVDACQMSTDAFCSGFPVVTSVTLPCM